MTAVYDWIFQLWPDAMVILVAKWHMAVGALIFFGLLLFAAMKFRSAKSVQRKQKGALVIASLAIASVIAMVNGYLIYRWKIG